MMEFVCVLAAYGTRKDDESLNGQRSSRCRLSLETVI